MALGIVCLLLAGCTAEGGEPVPEAPTPTPAGLGSLAYAADGDIFVAEWDGSHPVRIADGRPPGDCGTSSMGEYLIAAGPIWSPDGRYLAYRHNDCGASSDTWWDVVISDSQGNVVASFPGEGWGIPWSPDSTRVAVWDSWDEGTIGVYGLDGVRQTLLTPDVRWGEADPVWSPDGESLLLGFEIEIPLDGSPPRELPGALRGGAWPATFSPDGSRIAYNSHGSLFVAEADGSHPEKVFGDGAWSLVWSPTGDRIAFTSGDDTELRLLDVATGKVTLLTETDGSDMLLVIAGGFEFSSEGDRILFSRTGEDRDTGVEGTLRGSSLWSVNADGSDLRRLVAGTAYGDWLSR